MQLARHALKLSKLLYPFALLERSLTRGVVNGEGCEGPSMALTETFLSVTSISRAAYLEGQSYLVSLEVMYAELCLHLGAVRSLDRVHAR